MLTKTAAIVLHRQPYTDKGHVVHLYTQSDGRMAVLAHCGKHTTTRAALIQPLQLLDLIIDVQPHRNVQYIRESRPATIFRTIGNRPETNAVALFLAEVLYRTLRLPQADTALFNFLYSSILYLDTHDNIANFHLVFLMKLAHHLGFFPNLSQFDTDALFDMEAACFCHILPPHPYFLQKNEAQAFAKLVRMNYKTMHLFALSHTQRNLILQQILLYYKLHLTNFPSIKSLEILQQVFNN